jgi:hypothetical protein
MRLHLKILVLALGLISVVCVVQMSLMSTPFMDNNDLFETGSTGGMPRELIDRIPKMRFVAASNRNQEIDSSCCSVCLQVSVISTCCVPSICNTRVLVPCTDMVS